MYTERELTYPFENNLFEEYLEKLRRYRRQEYEAYCVLYNINEIGEGRDEWSKKFKDSREKIIQLKKDNQIPPRTFDVYLGELNLALEKFYSEFPQPDKPEACRHEQNELRLKRHSDDTNHIVSQCLDCGGVVKTFKMNTVLNWKTLPPFVESLKRRVDVDYQRWWDLKNEIIEKVIGKDGRYPKFDIVEFSNSYELEFTEPMSSSNCSHENIKLTKRQYKNNNNSVVVRQCIECGKHIENVPSKSVDNVSMLADYNEGLENKLFEQVLVWRRKYSLAQKKAKAKFQQDLQRKISNKEVTRIDKTTFGSYYSTKEWKNTRSRMLNRDNGRCQACGLNAECVHHLTYDRLGRENDLDLISLCNECHNTIHKYQELMGLGYQLTPSEIKSKVFTQIQECT